MSIGTLATGAQNAITDVPGVLVGHATVWRDGADGADGTVRSGVTAIVPGALDALFDSPVPAGAAALNGAGELTGSWQIAEWGVIETPVLLTSTMAVGRAYDATVEAMMAASPAVGRDDVVIPIVGECDDSFLSDARAAGVTVADARAAIDSAASGPVVSGAVGAGTGMIAFGMKAGIGTASRVVEDGWTVGVLALVNFGEPARLTVDGCPVGRALAAGTVAHGRPAGSCIVVVATDAPLDGRACERLARRAGLGLARTGSTGHHGSGEIFLAFATGLRESRSARPHAEPAGAPVSGSTLDPLFAAVVDATEEAVVDSLFVASAVEGRHGAFAPGLPVERVLDLLAAAGRPVR